MGEHSHVETYLAKTLPLLEYDCTRQLLTRTSFFLTFAMKT